MFAQRHCTGFNHHILEADFNRTYGIHLRAGCHGIIHIQLHGEIEVRSGEDAFSQTTRDGFAHAAVGRIHISFACAGRK